MILPHLHFKGNCEQAIMAYVEAFHASIESIKYRTNQELEKGIYHAELIIHGQRIMLNDNASSIQLVPFPPIQLVVIFEEEAELRKAFELLKDEDNVVIPMTNTEFSACTVSFWDKFGIRWGFMMN